MAKTGKTSAAALSVINNVVPINKIQPPENLDVEHLVEWLAIVDSKPPDFFGKEHAPLLEALCRHIVNAKKLAKLLDEFSVSSILEDDGLRRLEKLQKMHLAQTSAQERIMRSMRLTHQSIYRADKAPPVKGGADDKPWARRS